MADVADWKQLTNPAASYAGVPPPYKAPDWARLAVIHISMTTAAANIQPMVYVDDVEFVDITAGP